MNAPIHFTVAAPNPDDHLFHVTMRVREVSEREHIDLRMPVWSPGSYLVREYPRHVQNLRAMDLEGNAHAVRQLDKATWRVECQDVDELVVRYEVFSHELAVRTNHLDDSHGSFNGVALFLYHPDYLARPVTLDFEIPDHWQVYTGLDEIGPGIWQADDFDELFDCPVELGDYDPITFSVRDVPHEVVIWGEGNYDRARLAEDMEKIVAAHADLFGGLPYERYLFIVHLTDRGFGGLEHRNSTILLYQRDDFRAGPPGSEFDEDGAPDKKYLNFLRLVSHEHFHAWNVKRIRPAVLGPFDYQQENYTRDLWTVEGVTSYYENIGLLRAGLISGEKFARLLAGGAKSLAAVPGRLLHSLEDASFNAWVKLYRRDEHTNNSSVSYYLKGELICFILDARIRAETNNERSLDDVLVALWELYEETGEGYEEGSYGEWISRATGVDVSELLARHVASAREIDWDAELAPVGLRMIAERGDDVRGAWLGANLKDEAGRVAISSVPTDSPAHRAGLYAGDELIALDHRRVSPGAVSDLLKRYEPGQQITAHVARRGLLLERAVTLGEPPADTWKLAPREDITARQRELLRGWLGTDLSQDGEASS